MHTPLARNQSILPFNVREAIFDHDSNADLVAVRALRSAAWKEFEPGAQVWRTWRDPSDLGSRHWLIGLDDLLVAAARFSVHSALEDVPEAETYLQILPSLKGPIGSLNRLVIHPEYRGRGLSQFLDRERMQTAWAMGCQHVVAEVISGNARLAQLKRMGFTQKGLALPGSLMAKVAKAGTVPTVLVAQRPALDTQF